MHVKSHDQVLNALEPVPYSLFFSVELYLILQSVMITVSSLDSQLISNDCILSSTHKHITDGHKN